MRASWKEGREEVKGCIALRRGSQPARQISPRHTATWHLRGTKLSSLFFRADGSPAFTTKAREPSAAEEEEKVVKLRSC